MLEKGIVLELQEAYAIVLTPGGKLLRIKKKEGLQVGDQIYILPEDHYEKAASAVLPFPEQRQPLRQHRLLTKLAGLAAAVALIITLALYPGVQTVYAVASFDGEQDLQLELDHRSRILNGYSYGEPIPEEDLKNLKGKKLAEVGDELTALMGDGPVLIGYASHQETPKKDLQAEQLLRGMFSDHIILYLSGNSEDIDLAESSKKSLGFHLAGEIIDDDIKEAFDDFMEEYADLQEDLEELPDDESAHPDASIDDISSLNQLDLEELLDAVQNNPGYEKDEDILEIMADKMEDLHEKHKEQVWDSDDDSDDSDDDSDEEDEQESSDLDDEDD